MKLSENSGLSWSSRTIAAFSIRVMSDETVALAEAMRTGWPARHPSPKKSPGPNKAITPSFP